MEKGPLSLDAIIEKLLQTERHLAKMEERIEDARRRLLVNEDSTAKNYHRIITVDRNLRILTEKLNDFEKSLDKVVNIFEDKMIVDKAQQAVYDKQKSVILAVFGFIVTVVGLILPNLEQIMKAIK